MKRLLTVLTLFTVVIANASADVRISRPNSLVDVQVIDRTSGQTLETWRHHGRIYVAGTPGNRYAISIQNRTGKRILTVLSVDGINAVSGETSALSQRGYILSAHQKAEIAGWRKNLNEVAAFYFTQLPDSYAARTDRPQNVGVIGVAVFREYEPPRLSIEDVGAPVSRSGAKKAARPAPAAAQESLGTGHGERIESTVTTSEFQRASKGPAEIVTIYYDSHANLVARGIIPARPREPQAFPGNYVPDPK